LEAVQQEVIGDEKIEDEEKKSEKDEEQEFESFDEDEAG
jgi:hypothetical protein